MTAPHITRWIDALGYSAAGVSTYLQPGDAPADHPYGREIDILLGDLTSTSDAAVIDIEQTPTILFVDASQQSNPLDHNQILKLRQHIWNQNLVSIIISIDGDHADVFPVTNKQSDGQRYYLSDLHESGPLSFTDIATGNIQQRLPNWFDIDSRVDRELLHNLGLTLQKMELQKIPRSEAQLILGRVLFVSYLEHRGIIGNYYKKQRDVDSLHALIHQRNRNGLQTLFKSLKKDFNGDFLEVEGETHIEWNEIADSTFMLLDAFLSRVSMETGQTSLWNYDFRYIPVELLSGIYETFLNEEKRANGIYYTPRHLANLAVDLAFLDKVHPENEVVYDAACGSGILLTTAFRRMLRSAEHRHGDVLPIDKRIDLLLAHIRGSDLSEAACRVTAFSLYLALMEDIAPADIARLCDDANVKLPPLLGRILIGSTKGDFFNKDNKVATKALEDVTILLSNPPWGEPKGNDSHLYESWAAEYGLKLPHRNIAAAFAHKAIKSVTANGRVCLILPVKLFASDTSRDFLHQWISSIQIKRIINFSDIRRLLFPSAIHPCVVVIGDVRDPSSLGRIPAREMIEVWHAKADVSLAFGRLSVHGIDRHTMLASRLADDPETFRASTWGIQSDRAVIGRLRLFGVLSDLLTGKPARWQLIKGFNQTRHSSEKLDPGFLKSMRFLDTRNISRELPVLDNSILEEFPESITSVVSHGSQNGAAFHGARVLFPDGAASSFNAYAIFAKGDFCFRHTLAALCGPDEDEDILRFVAVYLRSPLAAYCLLHNAYALTSERTRITLDEIESLPFALPERTGDPEKAWKIIRHVADLTREIETIDFGREEYWQNLSPKINKLVYQYFGVSERELPLIEDACNALIPSVQPGTYKDIRTPLSGSPRPHEVSAYFERLTSELCLWRDRMGGHGQLMTFNDASHAQDNAAIGIATVELVGELEQTEAKVSRSRVVNTMKSIRDAGLWPMQATRDLALSSDFLIYDGPRIHIVKPMVRRYWLERQAFDDARRIVEAIGVATHG